MKTPRSITSQHGDAGLPPGTLSQQLIHSCQGIVRNLAWKAHQRIGKRIEMDDLISYGQIGLAEAAATFDPGKGNEFITYAYYRVRGAIYDGISKETWFKRDEYYGGRYEQTADTILEVAGDDPSEQEIRKSAGQFAALSERLAMAYFLTRSAGEREDAQPSESGLMQQELIEKLHEQIDSLPEQERQIIKAVYFDGISLQQISKDWGIAKGWVSRLHARGLERLGRGLRRIGAN